MPPKKAPAAAAAKAPAPRASPVAAAAAAVAVDSESDDDGSDSDRVWSQFPPPQTSHDLGPTNVMHFMARGIYQYLSQFGFEEAAEQLRVDIGGRFQPNPLTPADEAESHLRCSMYRTFTLTATATPDIQVSAEIVLDDLQLLTNLGHMPRTFDSQAFNLEVELRVVACIAVAHERGTQFDEVLEQYFPAELLASVAQEKDIAKRQAKQLPVSDLELRKQHLSQTRTKLEAYRKAKLTVPMGLKGAASIAAATLVEKFETNHTRVDLQKSVREFLKALLDRVKVQGPVFLEEVSKAFLQGVFTMEKMRHQTEEEDSDEAEEGSEVEVLEEEAKASPSTNPADEWQEAPEIAALDVEEEEEVEEEATPEPVKAPVKVKGKPGRKPKAKPVVVEVEEEEEEPVTPKKNKGGRPRKATVLSPPVRASPRVVPEAVRQLQAASATLKDAGVDPLADSLRSTQALSKRRRSEVEVEEEPEEEEEDVNVELEIEEEPAPAPTPKRKAGRPRKVAKYDVEQAAAEKVEFSSAISVEEIEDDDAVSLPQFKSKKTSGIKASPGKTPAQLAKAASDDASQRARPAVHRHAVDRSAKRVPWSTEEIQKLTEGVVEFASARKKWSLILTKYNEFFSDRTVVDLKDKWRNLKVKIASSEKKSRKGKANQDEDEELEAIEDD